MKILGRIALVIAILACGISIFFGGKLKEMRDSLRTQVANLTADKQRLTTDLAATTETLKTTKATLEKTKDELVTTAGLLEGKKVELAQKTQEADTCKQTVADKTAELDKAKNDLASIQGDLTKIQDAMKSAGITDIQSVEQLRDKLMAQTEESKILGKQMMVMRDENTMLKQKVEELSTTPVNLRGTVAEVRENWGFVVLSLGKNHRVQTNTDFLVYRDTKMVGKVQVRTVGQSTSVAEVLPEFQRSPLRVGDLVVH